MCVCAYVPSFIRDCELEKELKMLTSRLSIVLHDVTHKSKLSPTRCTETLGVHILAALFRAVAKYARIGLMQFKNTRQYPELLITLSKVVHDTINSFPLSCKMQHLLPEAAWSIMVLLESVLTVIAAGVPDPRKWLEKALEDVYFSAFEKLFDLDDFIFLEMMHQYEGRLSNMKELLMMLVQF